MTLLMIAGKIWRYKFVTLTIIGFVLAAAIYEVAVKPDIYQASASYILVSPPAPPTPEEIAREPELAKGVDNPYTRYSDQSIVVQVLASRLNSDDTRRSLLERGVDPRYVVEPSAEFGLSAPIATITGTGTTRELAIKSADAVGKALSEELARTQKVHGVAQRYRISAQQVVGAHDAQLKASGKLRAGVAVIAVGVVVLFIVISLLDGLVALKEIAVARAKSSADEEVGAEANGAEHGMDMSEWDAWERSSQQLAPIPDASSGLER
jgi:hypothetical protein